jgi:ankyrin repeat protein
VGVNSQDAEESTPLHRAAQGGYLDIVTLLLKSGADVNIQNSNNKTPLDLALINGRLDTARCLAEWMGNADSLDRLNILPDSLPGAEGPTSGHGTSSNIPDGTRASLHDASKAGDLELVRSLLEVGSHVNERDTYAWTPLMYASKHGITEVAKLLIEYGADVNARDSIGWTALQAASRYGQADVVGLLLNHGADVNAMNQDQWNALHLAVFDSSPFETVKTLLEKGADVHVRNDIGRTPFQTATRSGDRKLMQLLLEFGARGK